MSTSDLLVAPTPEHLTLLLKHGKSTTVLSVLPSQTLTEVKAILLTALQIRNIATLPNSDEPLPTDPKDLELAVLVDRRDPARGWVSVEDGVSLAASKSNKKKSTTKTPGQINVVGDLELRDGAWIAYRLKMPDDGIIADEMDDDIKMREDQGWNVTIPSYDDEEEDNISIPNDTPGPSMR